MAHTAALAQLIQQLHTDPNLQQQFEASPQLVCENWDLTSHEHDAMVSRDCNDLVALGVADSSADLPDVVCGGGRDPGVDLPGGSMVDQLRDVLKGIRKRLPKFFDRLPFPPRKPTPPGPGPGPDPPGP